MGTCCIFKCKRIKNQRRILHRFPSIHRFPGRFKAWVRIAGGKLESLSDYNKYKKKYVCEAHFTERDVDSSCKTRLAEWAIPSLNLPELSDHGYTIRKYHEEHSYVKAEFPFRRTIKTVTTEPVEPPKDQPENTNIEIGDDDTFGGDNDDHTRDDDVEKVSEDVPEPLFSWERTQVIEADEMEVPTVPTGGPVREQAEPSMYQDDDCVPVETDSGSKYINYRCNECNGNIFSGFRYTCVQCVDWDICGACEAREAHGAHYVLRVPSGRPYKEMQAVLETIRHQLMSENLFIQDVSESLKAEIKEEPVEEAPLAQEPAEPAAEPDPLACIHPDDELIFYSGEVEVNSDAPSSSKRPRLEPARHPRDDTASIASDDYPIETLDDDFEDTLLDDTQIELPSSFKQVEDDSSEVLTPNVPRMGREEVFRQHYLNRLRSTKVGDDSTTTTKILKPNIIRKLSTDLTIKRVVDSTSTATAHRFSKAPASQVLTRNIIPSTSTRGSTTSEIKMSDNSKTPHRTTVTSSERLIMIEGCKEVEQQDISKRLFVRVPKGANPTDVMRALKTQVSVPIVPFKIMSQRPTRSRLLSEDIP